MLLGLAIIQHRVLPKLPNGSDRSGTGLAAGTPPARRWLLHRLLREPRA